MRFFNITANTQKDLRLARRVGVLFRSFNSMKVDASRGGVVV